VVDYVLGGEQRMTVDVNSIPGLATGDVSAVVNTTLGGVVVERTMIWDDRIGLNYGGHTGKAVQSAKTEWFLAEGEANFFDTWILFANANTTDATVTVTYLLDDASTVVQVYPVKAQSRQTVLVNTVPGVQGRAFSARIVSDLPITVERSMYFSTGGRFWNGGHESAAVSAPSTTWFIAEGRTGSFFDMYLLLANPGSVATDATVRYLLPSGNVITVVYSLPPTSRTTILVDAIAGLEDTDVSASVTATQPIIVERAMYWPAPFPNWYEAHNSVGLTQTGVEWVLAEGEHAGPETFETYVLLANPYDREALVTLTVLRDFALPLTVNRVVPANSRVTVHSIQLGVASGEKFGVRVNSDFPIAVERAMYWSAGGQFWSGGTNETGVRVR
jgi:hypothetical protein